MLSAQRSNTIQSDFGHWPSIGQITLVGWREQSSDLHILSLYLIQKMALYCPKGSGTLRQQLLMMQGIAW